MRTYLECLPCLLRQAVEASKMATDDERLRHTVVKAVLRELQSASLDARPVDIAPRIHALVRDIGGCEDPYRELKAESNKTALRAYPKAAQLAAAAPDPFLAAAKLAAAGNVADAAIGKVFDFGAAIDKAMNRPFTIDHYADLQGALAQADHVLYLADNAGEIVFDRLLLERLLPRRITLAVKGRPLLNDATVEDAESLGLRDLAALIPTGDGWPRPDLAAASSDLRRAFREADVIIAKGQANYEALSESADGIFFLLLVKCETVARDLGVSVGDLILKNAGHDGNDV